MICIIGAGISGLTVAEALGEECVVLEKSNDPGGLATQYRSGEHWFDFSGHYFHFTGKEEIHRYVERFGEFRKYERDSRTLLFGRLIPFPVQYHLSWFPRETGEVILSEMRDHSGGSRESLEESLISTFGSTLFGIFFEPFMTKYYRRNLSQIIPAMDRGSIPVPDIKSVEEGLAGKKFKSTGYNPHFYYPVGGLRRFIGNLEQSLSGEIRYNEPVLEIDLNSGEVVTDRGKHRFSRIVNTMPLKELVTLLNPRDNWFHFRDKLESVSTLVVNFILREKREDFHWVYLPEPFTPFYRAGYYPGHPETAGYLERSLIEGETVDTEGETVQIFSLLKRLNMIVSEEDVLHLDIRVIPDSYVIFNRDWKKTVPGLLRRLEDRGIHSIGRYGSWNYTSMSDDIKSGLAVAEKLKGEL